MSPDGAPESASPEKRIHPETDLPGETTDPSELLEKRAETLQRKIGDFQKKLQEYERKAKQYGTHGKPLRDELGNVQKEFAAMFGANAEEEMDRRVEEFLKRLRHTSVESERGLTSELNRDRSPEAGAMRRLLAALGDPAITVEYLRAFRANDPQARSGFRAESFVKRQTELVRSLGREMNDQERLRIAGLIVNGEWDRLTAMQTQLHFSVEEQEIKKLQANLQKKENDIQRQRSILARNASALGALSSEQTGLLGKKTGLGKDITVQIDRQAKMTLQATRELDERQREERNLRKSIDLKNVDLLRMQDDALRQSDPDAADLALVRSAMRIPGRAFDDSKAKGMRERVEKAKTRLRESGQWDLLSPEEQALATQNDLTALRMRVEALRNAPQGLDFKRQLTKRSNFFVAEIAPAQEFMKDRAHKGKVLDAGGHKHDFYANVSLLSGKTFTVGISKDLVELLRNPSHPPLVLLREPKDDIKITTRTHTKTRNAGRGETIETEVVDEHRITDCDVITMADIAPRGNAETRGERSFTLREERGSKLRTLVTIEEAVIRDVLVSEEAERKLRNAPEGYTAVLRRVPQGSPRKVEAEDIVFVKQEKDGAFSVDTDGDGAVDQTHTEGEFEEEQREKENVLKMMSLLTPIQDLERSGSEIMARFGPLQALLEGMANGKPTEQAVHTAKEYARSLLSVYSKSKLLSASQKMREVIGVLRSLPKGIVPDDIERAILQTEQQLSVIDQLLSSGAIPKMCAAIAKLRPDTWETWWEREGIIVVAAVAGAVLVASGIGAPIAAVLAAKGLLVAGGWGALALTSVAGGVGGYLGAEVGKGISDEHTSEFTRHAIGEISGLEYLQNAGLDIGRNTLLSFALVGAGQYLGKWAAQYAKEAGAKANLARFVQRAQKALSAEEGVIEKFTPKQAKILGEFIQELFEETAVEKTLENLGPIGQAALVLRCSKVTVDIAARSELGVTLHSAHRAGENIRYTCDFSTGKREALVSQLQERKVAYREEGESIIFTQAAESEHGRVTVETVYIPSTIPEAIRTPLAEQGGDGVMLREVYGIDEQADGTVTFCNPEGKHLPLHRYLRSQGIVAPLNVTDGTFTARVGGKEVRFREVSAISQGEASTTTVPDRTADAPMDNARERLESERATQGLPRFTIEEIQCARKVSKQQRPLSSYQTCEYTLGGTTVYLYDVPRTTSGKLGLDAQDELILVNALVAHQAIADRFGVPRETLFPCLNTQYHHDDDKSLMQNWGTGINMNAYWKGVKNSREKGATDRDLVYEMAGQMFHEVLHDTDEDLVRGSQILGGGKSYGEFTTITGQTAYYLSEGWYGPYPYDAVREKAGLIKIRNGERSPVDYEIATCVAAELLYRHLADKFPEYAQGLEGMDRLTAAQEISKRIPPEKDAKRLVVLKEAIADSANKEKVEQVMGEVARREVLHTLEQRSLNPEEVQKVREDVRTMEDTDAVSMVQALIEGKGVSPEEVKAQGIDPENPAIARAILEAHFMANDEGGLRKLLAKRHPLRAEEVRLTAAQIRFLFEKEICGIRGFLSRFLGGKNPSPEQPSAMAPAERSRDSAQSPARVSDELAPFTPRDFMVKGRTVAMKILGGTLDPDWKFDRMEGNRYWFKKKIGMEEKQRSATLKELYAWDHEYAIADAFAHDLRGMVKDEGGRMDTENNFAFPAYFPESAVGRVEAMLHSYGYVRDTHYSSQMAMPGETGETGSYTRIPSGDTVRNGASGKQGEKMIMFRINKAMGSRLDYRDSGAVLEYMKSHPDFSDDVRISIAEQGLRAKGFLKPKGSLSDAQKQTILEAHEYGKGNLEEGYSQGEENVKGLKLMRDNLFTREQAQYLLDAGICGKVSGASERTGNTESLDLSTVWRMVCAEHPSMANFDFTMEDPGTTPVLKHTGGLFRAPSKRGERPKIIATLAEDAHFQQLKETRKISAQICSEMLGLPVEELTPRALKLFIFLHESGHGYDFRKRYPTYSPGNTTTERFGAEWRALRKKELETLPLPGVNPAQLELLHRDGKLGPMIRETPGLEGRLRSLGITNFAQLHIEQNRAYRALPTEAFADKFATDFMKRHPELWQEASVSKNDLNRLDDMEPNTVLNYMKSHPDFAPEVRLAIAEQGMRAKGFLKPKGSLSDAQKQAILEAHEYKQGKNVAKGHRLMRDGLFTREAAQYLMDAGICGKAGEQKPAPEAIIDPVRDKCLKAEEFKRFMEEHGFTDGFHGTFESKSKGCFLYLKRQYRSSTLEGAQTIRATIEHLTEKGMFHPDTRWGICQNADRQYQVFGIMKRLEACKGNSINTPGKQPLLTRNQIEQEIGHDVDEGDWYDALLSQQDSHFIEWMRRISPAFDPTQRPQGLLSLARFGEASHADNWGWDQETGRLYPIDVEVFSFESPEALEVARQWRSTEHVSAPRPQSEHPELVPSSSLIQSPKPALLEKVLQDPQVRYVSALQSRTFGGEIFDPNTGAIINIPKTTVSAEESYKQWREHESPGKSTIYVYDEFVLSELDRRVREDFKDRLPVQIRGVALNLGETFKSGTEVIAGLEDVLRHGNERLDRETQKVLTLNFTEDYQEVGHRTRQWILQSTQELREKVSGEKKDQIFPALLVYDDPGAQDPQQKQHKVLQAIYILDYMDGKSADLVSENRPHNELPSADRHALDLTNRSATLEYMKTHPEISVDERMAIAEAGIRAAGLDTLLTAQGKTIADYRNVILSVHEKGKGTIGDWQPGDVTGKIRELLASGMPREVAQYLLDAGICGKAPEGEELSPIEEPDASRPLSSEEILFSDDTELVQVGNGMWIPVHKEKPTPNPVEHTSPVEKQPADTVTIQEQEKVPSEDAPESPKATDSLFSEKHRNICNMLPAASKHFESIYAQAGDLHEEMLNLKPDDAMAFNALQMHCRNFRTRLEEREPQGRDADSFRDIIVEHARDMLNSLVRLDGLLPGVGEDGMLPSKKYSPEVVAKIQKLRDDLCKFITTYTTIEEYRPPLNATISQEYGKIDVDGTVDVVRVRPRCVAVVLEPGYIDPQGTIPVIKRARVKITR